MASSAGPGSLAQRRVTGIGRASYRRLRTYLIVAVQAGLAAALSWVVARQLLGNREPTFAPAAAVGVIAAALGNRARSPCRGRSTGSPQRRPR
jgi:hypothetical protein